MRFTDGEIIMDFDSCRALVYGSGISGRAAAELLLQKGAHVLLYDENEKIDREKLLAEFKNPAGLKLITGKLPEEDKSCDLLVLSPGIPLDNPLVEEYRHKDIPVIGEVELAYLCQQGETYAITGTNGKTTTTALLGEIMRAYYEDVRVVGNIGIPYAGSVGDSTPETKLVAEISSFQLETALTFRPKVSAILNITPDHLNRHHTMENYIAAKLRIAGNQTQTDYCVLNYDDEALREAAGRIPAQIVWFSSKHHLKKGMYLDEDRICYNDGSGEQCIALTGDLNILGRHNHENAMAAALMALLGGVDAETIRGVLRRFQAVEHRIEFVAEKRGVRFYNDSKGTNPDAAIKGILAMDRPTFLIAGGYDKESDYEEWIRYFPGRVKKLILIGQTREKIAQAAASSGFHAYVYADSLAEAVSICCREAVPGDAVLLSPACASWGMFPNYEVRGKMFKELVHALKE